MSEQRAPSLWERLRKKNRKELDRIQRDLVMRTGEKREFAGDPNQTPGLRIPLNQK